MEDFPISPVMEWCIDLFAAGGGAAGLGGLPGGFGQIPNMGGLNLEAMLNNPAMMNVAAQMMQDPNMQQMMNNLMGGGGGGAGGPPAPGGGGFEALLQA